MTTTLPPVGQPAGPGELVEPAYGRRSIADVLPAVARALGAGAALDGPDAPEGVPEGGLVLPDAPAYVVLLIDGLGARNLERHAHAAPFLAGLLADDPGATATAGVPSTTATSLTSIGTGLPPGAHGVVGYTSRIPGTDRLLNALRWDEAVDPREWQPHPTVFDRIRPEVDVSVVNSREFASSGLTAVAHRGAEYVGADKVGERIAAASALADGGRTHASSPSLTYLYEPDLDWTGHRHGVASSAWLQELTCVDAQAEQLRDALPERARLLVIADHGMVDSPPEARVDVDSGDRADAHLRDGVQLVGGEARFRHLYCRGGAVDDVVAAWRARLGERAEVITRDEAVERGWFGALEAGVRARVGDVLVAARGDLAVLASADFPIERRMVGMHGSLTETEMVVPLLLEPQTRPLVE